MSDYYKRLYCALEELLANREPKIEPPQSGMDPLFLQLNIKPDLVGFSALSGNLERGYSKAFNKFRELYAIHSSDWADFDLTLVFCVDKGKGNNEYFYKKIERDAYFCRKFVIDLNRNVDIRSELGHLPFIPLSPEKIIGLRPTTTAQTLLMEHGVNTSLARYLTIPQLRGADGIISDVLKGKFGDSQWKKKPKKTKESEIQIESKPKIRLKELEINNFRAYKGTHKFNLDADLIVLHGPNGLGKTSLYDAIDFICTGSEAKLDEKAGRDVSRIIEALTHLDTPKSESYVKTLLSDIDGDYFVERQMDNKKNTYINSNSDNRFNRIDALVKFTGLEEEPIDIRIENFVRLFRATHLFGQDFQSLTSEMSKNSRLSEDIISRMLALQDYFEAIKKTKEIVNKLVKDQENKRIATKQLFDSVKGVQSEIQQLKESTEVVGQPEVVQTIGKKLFEKIIKEKNLQIEKKPKQFNKNIAMGWRIIIISHIEVVLKKLTSAKILESRIKDYYLNRQEVTKKRHEISNIKKNIHNFQNDTTDKKKLIENINEDIKQQAVEESNLRKRNEDLKWLYLTKKEYSQTTTDIGKETESIKKFNDSLLIINKKYEKLKSNKTVTENDIKNRESQNESYEKNFNELNEFSKLVPEWINFNIREKEFRNSFYKSEKAIEQTEKKIQSKKDEVQFELKNQIKLENYVSTLQKAQTEFKTLLDDIEKHVLNNTCPVCGTAHKSKKELLEKLNSQKGVQPVELKEELTKLNEANQNVKKIQRQLTDLELNFNDEKQKKEKIQNELSKVKHEVHNLKEKAVKLELPIVPDPLNSVINEKKDKILRQSETNKKKLEISNSKLIKVDQAISDLLKQRLGFEEKMRIAESNKKQISKKSEMIEKEVLERKVLLGETDENIQKEIEANKISINRLTKAVKRLRDKSQRIEKEVTNISKKINIHTNNRERMEEERKKSANVIEEVENLIKEFNLSLNVTEIKLQKVISGLYNEGDRLKKLRNEIINFEIALDSAMHSATLHKAMKTSADINSRIEATKKEQSLLKDKEIFFLNAQKELESARDNSLNEYTKKYGPLASTIQGRLRTPYGFGRMNLSTQKGEIVVKVEREKKKSVLPSDYFSASQINIVALSLFLSAALTQTWSRFAPILLDDPVTHFDDLNSYSFIDLIKGIILSQDPKKGHQFIISTCEDKLYRLMKQKFSRMNGRVLFYIFKSIGEKGPVWHEEKY